MTAASLDIRLLGPFEVVAGGRSVVIGSPKQRLLLAMLAVHGRCSVDALAEELWDGRPPASLAPTLQSLVSRLRRILHETVGEGAAFVSLEAAGDGYRAEFADGVLDAVRFERMVAEGQRSLSEGEAGSAAERFRAALVLWRGPALDGLADRDFARAEAVRLDNLRFDITEELIEAELRAGQPASALAVSEKHLADQPLRERAWGQRMLALYRLGRQAEALRAYQTVRHLLSDELGLDPTPALSRLESMILRHDPALQEAVTPPVPPGPVARPSAMAAFLLTDIVASTRRWDEDRESMGENLARHDDLVRRAIGAHHGTPFTHTGDGVAAAFGSAAEAVGAAVSAQRAIGAARWSGPEPLRVRMAVHVGTTECRDGTYLGPALHRLARLLDITAGGQIVCSGAAADLAREGLPSGVTLVDVGEHGLAGFAHPERVYVVVDPTVPSTAGPSAGLASRPGIPPSPTSFVGRERELAQLEAQLHRTRLLTVTGVGGAGKTRLALEAARRTAKRFPDGAWLVDLVPVREFEAVADAVTSALGLLTGDRCPLDVVCAHLADRAALLVLDNCEHVLAGVRAVIDAVLSRCLGVVILATSREVLGVPGETLWAAPALSMPPPSATAAAAVAGSDAVALFAERAATSLPGFTVSDVNAAAVSRICHRLDGLPLALELAAARMRVLGAQQLADRLDDRFRTLGLLPAGADPRHRTLRATMEWSWALLAPAEQAALAFLSVFPASFDLEAAEAVAGENGNVLDLIVRLVDTSLLVVEPGDRAGNAVRYRLLETVRQFAAEQLAAAGETTGTERRHLHHFLDRCERWGTSGRQWYEADWTFLAHRDREDFDIALDRALTAGDRASAARIVAALWPTWIYMGRMAMMETRIERTLSSPPATPPWITVEATLALGCARWETGRGGVDGVRVPLAEALEVAERTHTDIAGVAGIPAGELELARVFFFLGQVMHWAGDAGEGAALLHRARELFLDAGDRAALMAVGWCDYELGWAALTTGEVSTADELFASALSHEERSGSDALLRTHSLAGAAVAVAALGRDTDRAGRYAAEAVLIARTLPFPGLQAMALCRAVEAAALSGDITGSAATDLLHTVREVGGVRWVARALALAALALDARGLPEDAAAALASAHTFGEPMASTPALARSLEECGERIIRQLRPDTLRTIETAAAARRPDKALLQAIAALRPA